MESLLRRAAEALAEARQPVTAEHGTCAPGSAPISTAAAHPGELAVMGGSQQQTWAAMHSRHGQQSTPGGTAARPTSRRSAPPARHCRTAEGQCRGLAGRLVCGPRGMLRSWPSLPRKPRLWLWLCCTPRGWPCRWVHQCSAEEACGPVVPVVPENKSVPGGKQINQGTLNPVVVNW